MTVAIMMVLFRPDGVGPSLVLLVVTVVSPVRRGGRKEEGERGRKQERGKAVENIGRLVTQLKVIQLWPKF